jgi:hypothetical protein
MKKVFSILAVLTLFVITSCETERIIFTGPYFVRFSESALSVKESFSKTISIEVQRASPFADEDITVSYKLSGSARVGIDYTILGESGKITINKGEYVGSIQVKLINNSNNIIRSQDVIFTLESVTGTDLQIGQGESAIGKAYALTIIDDCILGGTYIGQRGSTKVSDISITSNDCENYILSNWNINVFNSGTEMDLKFIDNGDNTLTVPEQEEENLDSSQATITGSGVVDPLTRKIILTITLVDFTNQPQVTITYIPD